MIRRHYLVEIKRVKELLLSTLSPPHHGPTPANHLSIRRNHGSPVASTRVLQHIPPQSGQTSSISARPLCAKSGQTQCSKISTGLGSHVATCLAFGAARQAHCKHRALAWLARHGHVATHHARELAGDSKTKSGATEALAVEASAWVDSS